MKSHRGARRQESGPRNRTSQLFCHPAGKGGEAKLLLALPFACAGAIQFRRSLGGGHRPALSAYPNSDQLGGWQHVRLGLYALGAAILALLGTPAHAITAKELLRQCEALEKGAVVKGQVVTIPAGRDPAEGWAYMAAAQDFTATAEHEGGPSILGSCVPAATTRLAIIRVFTKYARAHRAELDVRATAILIQALAEAYACRPAR